MNSNRIFAMVGKEWAQIFARPITLIQLIAMPLLCTVALIFGLSKVNTLAITQLLPQIKIWVPLFLLIIYPLGPLGMAVSYSNAGISVEKLGRTLEALLSTPLSTAELLLGKILSATGPVLLEFWLCYTILAIATSHMRNWIGVFFNSTWLLAVFAIAPLLTFLGVCVTLTISARTAEVRKAAERAFSINNCAAIFFIGIILYVKLKLHWEINSKLMMGGALVLCALNVVFFFLAIRLFARETIISKW